MTVLDADNKKISKKLNINYLQFGLCLTQGFALRGDHLWE